MGMSTRAGLQTQDMNYEGCISAPLQQDQNTTVCAKEDSQISKYSKIK